MVPTSGARTRRRSVATSTSRLIWFDQRTLCGAVHLRSGAYPFLR
jgi:hypothetical protein